MQRMHIELVATQTRDDVRLDGYLRTAGQPSSQLGVDLVICHHGVGGNFYTPSFFDRVGEQLEASGAATLRVNNRGHDQAYQLGPRRLGAAYEVLDDSRHDFSAWLDFAQQRGYRRIALWGHSLGAVKTVYFQSQVRDPRVVCAIASSPPRFVHAVYRTSEHGERFANDIARAQLAIDAGDPERIIEALIPQNRPFSARTYVDKYGPNARFDYFQYLSGTPRPLLLTLGGQERGDISFAPLAERGPSMHAEWPHVSYALIDNADHMYTHTTPQLWNAVRTWLEHVAAPVAT
jgi:pimeloyl-ACP methyl ester carboxylesterase